MNILARIADRVIGRPLLLHPLKAELIAAIIGERIGVSNEMPENVPRELLAMRDDKPAANRMIGEPVISGRGWELYRRVGSVGVIPVVGSLTNRGVDIGESSGFTSYESIAVQLLAALADQKVGAIMFDIDSPGGEALGMFALAETIRAARNQKPITALVNDMAASAAYGIAASASEIVVSPTSIVGSIGVIMMHVDRSGEMEMKGRKATIIHAGAHKVDGHPFGPLSESVRTDMQREVDTFYARFVDVVASGRSKLSSEAIRSTEARLFIGQEAVDNGLADRVGTFNETLSRLTTSIRTRGKHGGSLMSNQNNEPIARAEYDAAILAARAEGHEAGLAEGAAAGTTAGREAATARIRSILTCAEAKAREPMALVFALDSDMTPETAAKALAAAPAAKPPGAPGLAERGSKPLAGNDAPADNDASTGWDAAVATVNKQTNAPRPGR